MARVNMDMKTEIYGNIVKYFSFKKPPITAIKYWTHNIKLRKGLLYFLKFEIKWWNSINSIRKLKNIEIKI
jgi:hypothetical protein